MILPFANETYKDFSQPENQKGMRDGFAFWRTQLGEKFPNIVGGKRIETSTLFPSVNPNNKSEVIAEFCQGGPEVANQAVEVAAKTFESWKRLTAEARAEYLLRAAAEFRRRRWEINALMSLESGKGWLESDADTAEAIDFLEFYARMAMDIANNQGVTPFPGEKNEIFYIPLGVVCVLPPWNFPCAILTGMTSAAIVSGNTVVLKPSPDSSRMAQLVYDIYESIGLPDGVINLIYGGPETGEPVVKHPKTRMIAFTGSKAVGTKIYEAGSIVQPGQIWLKRVIAEMGGKDTIIVDDPCDLEAAIHGVWVSAFGFSGQKCSACSRAVVHERLYDDFVAGLKEKVQNMKVGPVEDPDNFMGAVINQKGLDKSLAYIAHGKKEGKLLIGGEQGDSSGFFVDPTVFIDVDTSGHLYLEEVFGPVLAVTKFSTFDEGIDLANRGPYGLTGGLFATERAHIRQAKEDFHVGNLYVNRKCTGALVDVQPFGGFNMSGTDSKAGGRDYLLLFQQMKSVAERL